MIHFDNLAEIYSRKYVPIWLISAFKAGFINSAGFLITGKFVSHVTGFGTNAGLAIGHQDYFFGAELLFIPLSFIFGGVVTSYMLDRDYRSDQTPPYHVVQGFITFMILMIILVGELGIQDSAAFDSDSRYNIMELFIISGLCFVCGLKNSLVTWTTYGKIRVTHLTGLSTDIGLNLIRTFIPGQPSPRFKEERKVNIIRILTFTSFSLGAFISAVVIPSIGFRGFLIVFVISLGMTILSILDHRSRLAKSHKSLAAV